MKKCSMKRPLSLVLAIALVFTMALALPTNTEAATKKITLNKTKATIYTGASATLKVKSVKGLKTKSVKWSSSNKKVVTVTSKGKITGKKTGKAKITATSTQKGASKIKATCTVTVKQGATMIQVPKTLYVQKGKTAQIKAAALPGAAGNRTLTYTSKNKKIATVDKNGKVKGVKVGTTKITVKLKNGTKSKTVTVTVKKKITPVKKITLDKTKAAIAENGTVTLKATLSPKKPTTKTLSWVSSKPSVATVSSSGVVKGLKAGTAKITAYATDSGKVSKSCTVTVSPTIKAVSVINESTIQVDLTGAKQLTMSNFTVKLNQTRIGSYNKVCKLEKVSTANKTSYLLLLDSENSISDHQSVQVTVTGLGGTAISKTAMYNEGTFKYTDTQIYSCVYNSVIDKNFYVDGNGYSAMTVTGLPKGVQMEAKGTYARFYGKIQQAGIVNSTLVAVDEWGNTYTYSIIWMVGSSTSIVAAAEPVYLRYDPQGTYVSANVQATGGSGSYTYSLSGNTYGLQIDSSGWISGTLSAAGTYKLNVIVADANNANRKTTAQVVIYVTSTVTVSGVVKDLSGNPVPNAYVYCENKDKANKYAKKVSANTDANGVFSMSVPSGIYDIEACYYAGEGGGTSHAYLYSQNLTTTKSGFNITLPVQKVTILSNNSSVNASTFGTWYDVYGKSYKSGNVLWLKPGSYALTSTYSSGRITTTASANFTVPATAIASKAVVTTAVVKVTMDSSTAGTLTVGQPVSVNTTSSNKYYTFTPSVSGTYYFYSTGSGDSYGVLENAGGERLAFDDDNGPDNNFCFSYNCTAGVTYYVGIKNYSSDYGTFILNVSSTEPNFDNGNIDDVGISAVGECGTQQNVLSPDVSK